MNANISFLVTKFEFKLDALILSGILCADQTFYGMCTERNYYYLTIPCAIDNFIPKTTVKNIVIPTISSVPSSIRMRISIKYNTSPRNSAGDNFFRISYDKFIPKRVNCTWKNIIPTGIRHSVPLLMKTICRSKQNEPCGFDWKTITGSAACVSRERAGGRLEGFGQAAVYC